MASSLAFNTATFPDFSAKAWDDYMQQINSDYEQLIACVEEVALIDEHDPEDNPQGLTFDQLAQAIYEKYSLDPDVNVTLGDGWTSLRTLGANAHAQVSKYCDIDVSSVDGGTLAALTEETIPLKDQLGNSLIKSCSVRDAFEFMTESLRSSVTIGALVSASLTENVSARLQIYKDRISTVFKDAKARVANVYQWGYDLLSNASHTAFDIVSSIQAGMSKLTVDPTASVSDTDLYQYTGASPEAALDFGFAKTVVSALGGAIAYAVYSLWSTLKNACYRGLVKATTGIHERKYGYPMDIEHPGATAYGVEDFVYAENISTDPTHLMRLVLNASETSWESIQYVQRQFYSNQSKTLKYKLLMGELIAKMSGLNISQSHPATPTVPANGQQLQFKPYIVNPYAVVRCIQAIWPNGNAPISLGIVDHDVTSISSYNYWWIDSITPVATIGSAYDSVYSEFFSALYQQSDLYFNQLEGNVPKATLYAGVLTSWFLLKLLLHHNNYVLRGLSTSYTIRCSTVSISDPTNADFCQCFSGWNKNTSAPSFSVSNIPLKLFDMSTQETSPLFPLPSDPTVDGNYGFGSVYWYILNMYAYQQNTRYIQPLSWPFIPYVMGTEGFDVQMYRVRTDGDIQRAYTNLLTTITTIAIVAVLSVAIGVTVRKIAKAKFWKRQQFVSQMDSKMWNDPPNNVLTKAEKKKYIRYSRKLNASSLLTGSMASAYDSGIDDNGASMLDAVSQILNGSNTIDADYSHYEDLRRYIIGS